MQPLKPLKKTVNGVMDSKGKIDSMTVYYKN